MNQEQYQEFREAFRDLRGDVRDIKEDVRTVDNRLIAVDQRLIGQDGRIGQLETRAFSGAPATAGSGGGRATPDPASNGNGVEYYTLSLGRRTVLSVPKETMGRVRKWVLVVLLCLITGNADRLYALIIASVRAAATAATVAGPLPPGVYTPDRVPGAAGPTKD